MARMMNLGWRGLSAAALAGTSLVTTPAAADDDDGLIGVLPTILVDSGFGAHAVASAFRDQAVDTAVLVPELIFGIPQYLGLNVVLGIGAYDDGIWDGNVDPQIATLTFLAPAMMGTAMTVHGIVTAAGDELEPYRVVGVATLVGINLPITSITLGSSLRGSWNAPLVALVQVATTAPAMMGSVFAAAEDEPDRVGWALLAGWSGLQLAHGVVSLVARDDEDRWNDYGGADPSRGGAALSLWGGPAVVGEAAAQAPGLMLGGRF